MRERLLTEENRKWWTLAAVSFGLFMIMLDNTIVTVALPTIEKDLGITLSELEWIVTAYALTFAVFMLTGGKLADMFGRRLLFNVGLAIFTAASLACGLADNASLLIAARAVQGVGAAIMNPSTLSIVTATFPPRQRGMAIGIWAGVSSMALAIGPLLGGVLTQHLSWHWIFFVNVPVGVLGIVFSRLVIEETRDTSHEQRLDLPGLVSSGIALFALTFALIEANRYGWSSGTIEGLFVVAAVGLVVFVLLERHQRLPMLDLTLFRSSTFSGAMLVVLFVGLAMFGVFFYVSLFVQHPGLFAYSPTRTGVAFLPMTFLVTLIAPVAGKLSDHIGSRWLMSCGMAIVAIGLYLFSRLHAGSHYPQLLLAMVVAAVGMAISMTPTVAAAMSSVDVDKAGVSSAVLNSFRQVGGSLGIALMGAVLLHTANSWAAEPAQQALAARRGRDVVKTLAFVHGYRSSLLLAAGVALAAAIVALLAIRPHHLRHQAARPEPA
jgi:EmrB/QacA subfamily drug resistance transporter